MRPAQDCLPATPPAPDAIRPALSPLVHCGRRALRGLRDSKARPGPALAARLPRGCSLFMDPVANYLWAQWLLIIYGLVPIHRCFSVLP